MPYTFKHGDRPLDGVTIQRAVGRGGFGEVYYALTDSGKQVAVKYLRDNPEIELRGISHVMNLKSPYLITIYDVRKNPAGEPFVIMEYISGPSLRELLTAESGPMNPAKAAFLLTGICKGLSYLHERGIVHRDLKPANIFYDDGYVKIGDYGLSKHMSVSQHSGQTVSVGTVHYMAPEIGSGSYTKAIDIYAVGVILYEMLTGRLPFSGSSMAEILMKHVRDQPNLMGVPQPFANVIAKALAKDPNERYQDADEMLAAVMEHANFSQDAASFDASQLTAVPRHEARETEGDQTVTSPSPAPRIVPPPPPMDVRAPIADFPLPDRLQRKLERLQRKLERKTARLERKSGFGGFLGRQARRAAANSPNAPDTAMVPVEMPRGSRFAQFVVLALVTIGASIGVEVLAARRGFAAEDDMYGVSTALTLGGALLGILLAHFQILTRLISRSTAIDRLTYAACAAGCMLPAFGASSDLHGRFSPVFVGILVGLLLCDWEKRIDAGRRGDAGEGWGFGMWFFPALIGFIASNMMDAERMNVITALICGLFAALTPMAASMWPYPRRKQPELAGRAIGSAPPPPPAEAGRNARMDRAGFDAAANVAAAPGAAGGAAAPAATLLPIDTPIAVPPTPRSPGARLAFGIISLLLFAMTLGCFFALVVGQPHDRDVRLSLLMGTLITLAWQPFALSLALSRFIPTTRWRRVRWFVVSFMLQFAAAFIGLLAMGGLHGGERALAIFGLASTATIGGVILIANLSTPGSCKSHRRARAATTSEGVASPGSTGQAATPPVVVIDAQRGRGVASLASFLLLFATVTAAVITLTRVETNIPAVRSVQNVVERQLPIATGPEFKAPAVLVAAPLFAGVVLLLWSRRGQGWGPAIRVFTGGVLLSAAFWTAFRFINVTTSVETGEFGSIITTSGPPAGTLLRAALLVFAAFIVLSWPRSQRQQTIYV